MRRRLLSLVMALAMALSLLPTAAWAEEEQPPAGSTVSTEPASNEETQGTPTETSQPVEVEKDEEGSDLADVEEQAAPSNGTVPVPTPASEGNITIPGGTVDTNYTVSTEGDGVVTVTLKSDIPLTETWTIASGETVVLDLSGHALTADNNTVAIKNEGTLTIQDSSNGNGKVSGLRGVDNYGDLTLEGGTIKGTATTDGQYGSISIRDDNAKFLMTGGKIEQAEKPDTGTAFCYAISFAANKGSQSEITINGGTVADIYFVASNAKLNIGTGSQNVNVGNISLSGAGIELNIGKENTGTTGDATIGKITAIISPWGVQKYIINLNSGTVTSLPKRSDKITYGGTLGTLIQSNDASTLPGGYKFESVDGSGYHLVVDPSANPVSIISNDATQNYPSMGQALAALQEGDTLRLNQTYQIETSTDCIVVSVPNVTLDLNGFNIEMTKSIAYSPVQVDADGGTFRIINSETTPAKVQPYQPDQPASYTVAAVSAVSNGSGIVTVEVGENITLVNHVELGGGARTKAANLSEERENLCTVQVGEGGPDGYIYSFNDLDAIASLRNADTPVTVTLLGNATVGVEYTSSTVPMVVDLGGYTVSAASGRSSVISIPDGHDNVNLTVQNGTISGDGVSAASVLSEDCTLILDGLTMTSSGDFGIAANGSESGSEQSSAGLNLTVRNCSLTNCSLTNDSSSQESQGTVGIFFPAQEGTLTVENSQITGYNVGVQAFTGNITISGDQTKITGSGVKILNGQAGDLETSGPLFDGAAVSIIERVNSNGTNGYGAFESVKIEGGSFSTTNTDGESAYGALHVSQYTNTTSGGYTDGFENKPDSGTQIVSISGGTFSSEVPADYCAPGMVPSTSGGTHTVTVDSSVATDGNGTEASPYIIRDVAQLEAFRDKVNSGASYEGVYFALVSGQTYNISGSEWEPIGISKWDADSQTFSHSSFKGHFDGQGATITGLTMTNADTDKPYYNEFNDSYNTGNQSTNAYACFGFFGGVDGGSVSNLTFTNFSIQAPTNVDDAAVLNAAQNTVAVAVGAAVNGTHISSITIGTGTVTGASRAAGVVGYVGAGNAAAPASSNIPLGEIAVENCVNYATITSNWETSSHGTAGGICSTVNSYSVTDGSVTFRNNTNYGDASGYYAGGILASTFTGSDSGVGVNFLNNTNYGDISVTVKSQLTNSGNLDSPSAAGITVGVGDHATLSGNANNGTVDASDGMAAGIITSTNANTSFSGTNTNTGNVSGYRAGGIVATATGTGMDAALTSSGTITAVALQDSNVAEEITNPPAAGGIVAQLTGGAVLDGSKANNSGSVGNAADTPYVGTLVGCVQEGTVKKNNSDPPPTIVRNVSDDEAIGALYIAGNNIHTIQLDNVHLSTLDAVVAHTQSYTYTLDLENSTIGTLGLSGEVHTGMTLEIAGGTVDTVLYDGVSNSNGEDDPATLSFAASEGAQIGTVDASSVSNTGIREFRVAADEQSVIGTVRTMVKTTVGFEHSQSEESTANTDKRKFPNAGTISAVVTSSTDYTIANIGEEDAGAKDVLYLANRLTDDVLSILKGENTDGTYEAFTGVSLAADATADGTLTIANDRTLVIEEDVTLNMGGYALSGTVQNHGAITNLASESTPDVTTVVSFQVTPVNAEVVVKDGSGAEVPPVSVNEYHLENGTYTYTVRLEGYVAQSGSFTVDGSAGRTITISLQPVPTPVPDDDDDTPSYSGGSSTPSYSNTIEVGDGGDVKVSPRTPEAGETVTITPQSEAGYDVGTVTVTDRNGREVKVTEQRNSTYTFVQPAGRVTIEVTFVRTDSGLPFIDVAENAWYYDAVEYVYENGMMNGTGSNVFSPNATTTRGMIVTMLYRLEGEPRVSGTSTFDDVADGMYYADAVIWANANGIVTGYDEATFGPNDAITREQMAAILYRYAQYKGYDTTQGGMAIREYADYEEISEYALIAMDWAVNAGLVTGTTSSTLTPDGSAVRAQVATIFMRFMEDVAG